MDGFFLGYKAQLKNKRALQKILSIAYQKSWC